MTVDVCVAELSLDSKNHGADGSNVNVIPVAITYEPAWVYNNSLHDCMDRRL